MSTTLPLPLGLLLSVLTVLPSTAAAGQTIVGSGKPATREFRVGTFTALDIRQPFQVEIRRGDKCTASVTADDNLLPIIQVSVKDHVLRVALEAGKSYQTESALKLAVTLPALEAVTLGGAARTTVQGFKSPEFHARLGSASTLEGTIDADDFRLEARDGSAAELKGSAKKVTLSAQAASQLRLADFAITAGKVTLAGGSRAAVKLQSGKDFSATLKEASALEGKVEGADLTLEARGGSTITLAGSAKDAKLVGAQASQFQLGDLRLEKADVQLEGASSATIHASAQLDYTLKAASQLRYRGQPTVKRAETSDASSATHE